MTTKQIGTVLLVENEPLIALDLETMLMSFGAGSVHHVMSSAEALAWLGNNRPALSILDLFVQDGSTVAVAERLRAERLPFVVHSGHTRQSLADSPGLQDAVWLSKPCTEADLMSAIDNALGLSL